MNNNRAYSILNVKSYDSEKRVFTGVATTPSPDRVGDIVESKGVTFKNPLPLLLHHDRTLPVGRVKFSKPTADGVAFEATIANVSEAGVLADRCNEAWQSVREGLIKGVSIGFRPIEHVHMATGGIHFKKTEVYELSLVTVPCNAEATIQIVKDLDTQMLHAATGKTEPKNITAGVSAPHSKGKHFNMTKTIAESLAEYETKLSDVQDKMDALLQKSIEGTSLTTEEDAEYEKLEAEVATVTKTVSRLKARQGEGVANATPVTAVKSFEEGSRLRARVTSVKDQAPKGHAFTKFAMAVARSKGNLMQAAEMAKTFDDKRIETVLKAAVAAGTTTDPTWASPLVEYQTLQNEFIELLRPETIVGKMTGFRRVPFNVRLVGQATGSTVNWVGETKPKPVSGLSFDAKQLGFAKLAGIVVVSDELVKFSDPNIVNIVQTDMISTIAGFLDEAFLDPAKAAVAGVSPASITNGVTAIASSGTTADHLKADVQKVFKQFLVAGQSVAGSYWIMSGTQALAISMLQNDLGQSVFPGITMTGGTFFGLPVVVSEAPVTQGRIALVKPSEILLAEEGIVIDSSSEASVIMDTDPGRAGAPAPVSLWQNNLLGIRAERFINWGKRRNNAVGLISGANYGALVA